LTAIGARQYFKTQKIQIQDDVLVVGFGNWRLSDYFIPAVNQPGSLIGEKILKERELSIQG